jgi:hypothetical protein
LAAGELVPIIIFADVHLRGVMEGIDLARKVKCAGRFFL